MGTLKTPNYHLLTSIGSNNLKSKGNLKVKEKNPMSYSEDEGSNSTDEGSNFKNKGNKKGRSQCTYCRKYSDNENFWFINKIDIVTQFLERNIIYVLDFVRREKYVDPQGHCNNVQFKGNDAHALVAKIKYVSYISYFYTHFDLSE